MMFQKLRHPASLPAKRDSSAIRKRLPLLFVPVLVIDPRASKIPLRKER